MRLAAMTFLVAAISAASEPFTWAADPPVAVVVGPSAPELERFAASEVCGYLEKLFGIRARPATSIPPSPVPLILVVSSATNPAIDRWPSVSDQGIVLRRVPREGRKALVVGGGSPRATLWAVYELAQQWGVRYLLHGDVLPPRATLRWPEADLVREPSLRIRQWRVVNDFACGPESWGIADYRPVLDQLAKLKFNRIFVSFWPYQPFWRLEVRGIRRQKAYLWYDFHYPITDDMIGRRLFGNTTEFWNPDLPLGARYEELVAAGERLIHAIIAHAKRRGMEVVLGGSLFTAFPPEFAPLLKSPEKIHQLGQMEIVPGRDTDIDDPAVAELAAAVLRTLVNTYPEVDLLKLSMPEFRQWTAQYQRAWRALDAKYGVEAVRPLAEILQKARTRAGYPGGAERAVQEVQGDIVALYFFDRLRGALRDTRRPDMKCVYNTSEELHPVLGRILPAGSELLNNVDYTASSILARREVLRSVPSRHIPCSLVYTLHDDNVGLLPQLTTGSLHELTKDLRRNGWSGFSTRYWLIGDHDPCVSYLARTAWEPEVTPRSVYRDQIRAVCGDGCLDEMLAVLGAIEAATSILESNNLFVGFPVPGMIERWESRPVPPPLVEVGRAYQRALDAARRAKASAADSDYVDYWVGRAAFGVHSIGLIEELRRAAEARKAGKTADARQHAAAALEHARVGLESYARVARDQSDRGAIAILNEYVWRPLKAKVAAASP